MKIRSANLKDIPALLKLEQTFPGDRLIRSSFYHFLTKSKADVWVVEDDGLMLGDAVVTYRKHSKKARLYSIVVSSEARGKGFGGTLLGHLEKNAKKRGCTILSLEVREDNKVAIEFYRTRGYDIIGKKENYYEDGATALQMQKWLSPSIVKM
jgi:ribosomal protein S18 acetylase RimI-like enzyme